MCYTHALTVNLDCISRCDRNSVLHFLISPSTPTIIKGAMKNKVIIYNLVTLIVPTLKNGTNILAVNNTKLTTNPAKYNESIL